MIGVFAIQRHAVKCRGQARCGHALRQVVEAPVGAFRAAFAGKHARRVFFFSFEWENARRVGKLAWHVFLQTPAQNIAPVFESRQRHPRDAGVRQRFRVGFYKDVLAAHLINVIIRSVGRFFGFPRFQDAKAATVQVFFKLRVSFLQGGTSFGLVFADGFQSAFQAEQLPRNGALRFHPMVVAAVVFGDLRQITRTGRRDDVDFFTHFRTAHEAGWQVGAGAVCQYVNHPAVKSVHAGVVELGSDGADDRHLVKGFIPKLVVALVLLAHVAQGIEGAAFVKFIDRNDIGEIEHVNFFQLSCRAVFGGHHVEADVAVVNDFGVGLPDA